VTKFGGKTTRRGPLAKARSRRPLRITSDEKPVDKHGRALVPVAPTGRTSAKGDRTGLRTPAPHDAHLSRYADGSIHTMRLDAERDPETGRLNGVKISACRGCGHIRQVSAVTLLCGVRSCREMRQRRYQQRTLRRRAADWRARKAAEAEA
jgi:hypothetical protein